MPYLRANAHFFVVVEPDAINGALKVLGQPSILLLLGSVVQLSLFVFEELAGHNDADAVAI